MVLPHFFKVDQFQDGFETQDYEQFVYEQKGAWKQAAVKQEQLHLASPYNKEKQSSGTPTNLSDNPWS